MPPRAIIARRMMMVVMTVGRAVMMMVVMVHLPVTVALSNAAAGIALWILLISQILISCLFYF